MHGVPAIEARELERAAAELASAEWPPPTAGGDAEPAARPSPAQRALSAIAGATARLCGLDRSARVLAWLVVACMGLGLVMIYSTSAIAAERDPRLAESLSFENV